MRYIKRFNESVKHSDIINLLNVIKPYLNKTLDVQLRDNVLYVDVDVPSKFEGGKNEMISLQRYLQKYGMEKDSIASFYLKIEDNKEDKETFIKDLEDRIGYLQRKMKREYDMDYIIEYDSEIKQLKLEIEKVKNQSISNIEYVKNFLNENS